ncbi:MAG: 3-phosphoshikimate 1-carboxyvinyltransferase [Verrucomicrobiota bacterium]|nr:3-phosphoshikimate 1-carboxyvinyltransferase [Verrucomicrobiota bacterium]
MPLPELIEIVPLDAAPEVEITVPGSKSITNRALILAALAKGDVTLEGALWSEDTQVMVEALRRLGYAIDVRPDAGEPGNRTLVITGLGQAIPTGGTAEQPLELFVGNAGTAARFLTAFLCLGQGVYRLAGVPRMHERPQAALLHALRELGYRIDSGEDKLPVTIHGVGPSGGSCRVSIGESSQFASALLLGAGLGQWQISIDGERGAAAPYVAMTAGLIEAFPNGGGRLAIEPDASGGSYFWAAGHILAADGGRPVTVERWPSSGWQIDAEFPAKLPLTGALSRRDDLGDSIMTAITIAPLAKQPVRFTELGRLRVQECERVDAMRTGLAKCGAAVVESGDTLEISPGELRGATIETYDDHRMAMCFATLGLKVPGIRIKNPACVRKTFPTFFQKLAAPAPGGLGATLLDGQGNRLEPDRLAAD